MRTLLTRRAGQPGTKKLMKRFGSDLICVRYRYDADRQQRIKTAEIVVERVSWQKREPPNAAEPVRFRIEEKEELLRRAVLLAGGRWDEASDTWKLARGAATALGLTSRLRKR